MAPGESCRRSAPAGSSEIPHTSTAMCSRSLDENSADSRHGTILRVWIRSTTRAITPPASQLHQSALGFTRSLELHPPIDRLCVRFILKWAKEITGPGVGRQEREPLSPGAKSSRDLETVCCSPSPTRVNFTTVKRRQRLGGMLSYYHRAAVRGAPPKLTPNLHQGAFETYSKCMT
jgi:hypothetical protein